MSSSLDNDEIVYVTVCTTEERASVLKLFRNIFFKKRNAPGAAYWSARLGLFHMEVQLEENESTHFPSARCRNKKEIWLNFHFALFLSFDKYF